MFLLSFTCLELEVTTLCLVVHSLLVAWLRISNDCFFPLCPILDVLFYLHIDVFLFIAKLSLHHMHSKGLGLSPIC